MYEKFNREEERYATVVKLSGARKAEREKLISEYQKRSANAFAPQTLRNYQNIISKFQEWCDETGRSAEPPVEPQVIADYIDAMADASGRQQSKLGSGQYRKCIEPRSNPPPVVIA